METRKFTCDRCKCIAEANATTPAQWVRLEFDLAVYSGRQFGRDRRYFDICPECAVILNVQVPKNPGADAEAANSLESRLVSIIEEIAQNATES
jgi:acetone carboxylase gamma subunit